MHYDFKDLLRVFNEKQVRYLKELAFLWIPAFAGMTR